MPGRFFRASRSNRRPTSAAGPPGAGQMTELALSPSGSRADVNPWLVAAIVIIPTFMEVLDTTIALVALRYIAGGLSATVDDGEWVITSYLAANAVILPISGWLVGASRAPQLLPAVDCCLYPRVRRFAGWPQVSVS